MYRRFQQCRIVQDIESMGGKGTDRTCAEYHTIPGTIMQKLVRTMSMTVRVRVPVPVPERMREHTHLHAYSAILRKLNRVTGNHRNLAATATTPIDRHGT